MVENDGDRCISALSRRQEQAWHHAIALVKMKTTSWALCLANQFFAKTAYHLDASVRDLRFSRSSLATPSFSPHIQGKISAIAPTTPKRSTKLAVMMGQIHDVLRQIRALNDAPNLHRALLLDQPPDGEEQGR